MRRLTRQPKGLTHRIRQTLREPENNAKGLTASQLAKLLNSRPETVLRALINMPDSWIMRWAKPTDDGYEPQIKGLRKEAGVWSVVIPPPDCPHPKKGKTR